MATWSPPSTLTQAVTAARHHAIIDALGGWAGISHAVGLSNDPAQGVATESLHARAQWFGRNYIAPPAPKSLARLMFRAAFTDRTNLMLIGAGAASLLLGVLVGSHPATDWMEGTCVLIAVAAIVVVTALTEYKKERQFMALDAVKNNPWVHVVRDGGAPGQVKKWDLVVGDVVVLHTGDIVPADGVLLSCQDLRVDESTMTGEAEPVTKVAGSDVVLSGTTVVEGGGRMLVLCVGEFTQEGTILRVVNGPSQLQEKHKLEADRSGYVDVASPGAAENENVVIKEEAAAVDRTPLAIKLEQLNLKMGKIGAVLSTLLFIALSVKFTVSTFVVSKEPWTSDALSKYVEFFILAVTTLVVAIPEGLPLAVVIALTYSVRQMLRDRSLVRHLYACETAGNATIICSDKTGTLTTNQMTVTSVWLGVDRQEITAPQTLMQECGGDSSFQRVLLLSMAVNSTAELVASTGDTSQHSSGSPTECALLYFLRAAGVDYQAIRRGAEIRRMVPFNSDRKCMTTVVNGPSETCLVLTKGAPESLLRRCSHWRRSKSDTMATAMTDEDRSEIMESVVHRYAKRGSRTLCLAYKTISIEDADASVDEDALTLLAIVAINDPIRPEVPEAIALCKSAGVKVCIVTGDSLQTATAIAQDCGILSERDSNTEEGELAAIDAATFRARVTDANGGLLQAEFDKIWPHLKVLARATPMDKYLLVRGLINTQHGTEKAQLVAVTGDGTNDAAALKIAHIGFAMGQGTEVAKRASDIVVLDDNFMSIVRAIKWGRNVYDSIVKFLQFQLTMIIVAVIMAVVTALLMESAALTAIQILWVNLFMDMFVSLGLATEKPTDRVMQRKPYSVHAPLLSRTVRKHIIGQCAFQLVVLLLRAAWDWPLPTVTAEHSTRIQSTMVFNTFAWMQLFNQFNCRRIDDELNVFEGLLGNPVFIGGWLLQAALQFTAVQYGGVLFRVVPLDAQQWGITVGLAALSLPWGLVLRMI